MGPTWDSGAQWCTHTIFYNTSIGEQLVIPTQPAPQGKAPPTQGVLHRSCQQKSRSRIFLPDWFTYQSCICAPDLFWTIKRFTFAAKFYELATGPILCMLERYSWQIINQVRFCDMSDMSDVSEKTHFVDAWTQLP